MSDEEKAAHSSWSASSGASNADIVDEAQRRGFLSRRQATGAMGEAHDRDIVGGKSNLKVFKTHL